VAETTIPSPGKRGLIITLTDAAGTPLTFVVNHGEATPTWTDPVHDEVWAKDAHGDYLPTCRKGDQSSPAEIDLSGCRMFHAGDQPSEASAIDIVMNKGFFASGWTSSEVGSEFKCFQVAIRVPQNVAGTTYTTWTWTDCHTKSGGKISARPGGLFADSWMIVAPGAATVVDTP